MKRITLLTLLVMAGSMIIWSQVPQAMNYKAIAKDDWGVALPSKTITLRFTILHGSGTGSIVYQETHTTTTNKFGLMDVEIGKGTPSSINTFDDIDWSSGIYYIQIEMDPKGGSDFRLEDPAHQLLSVPYAFYAGNAGGVTSELDPIFGESPASWILSGDISNWNASFNWGDHALQGYIKTEIDGSTTNEIQNLAQVLNTGNDGGGIILKNIADPVDNQDAATKAYVDALEARIIALEADIEGLTDKDSDGYKVGQGDCNDDDPNINPSANEVYNGKDDNCNGTIDEGFVCTNVGFEPYDTYGNPYSVGYLYDDDDDIITLVGNKMNPYDEDWYQFYAFDTDEFPNSDTYKVKISFDSNPGGVYRISVYGTYSTPKASDVQYFVEESTTSDDGKWFWVKVSTQSQSIAGCANYTLKISNGIE
jgi:Putative metal-binding motif